MVNISIDVTDLGGEARPGDKVVFWRPRMGGSATHAGRVISTAPVTVFLADGKATVSDVEPGEMTVLLQCRGVESQGPVTVGVPDGNGTVTLRALLESQFEYAPPIVSAVQEAASNASASEEAAIQAQIRSEAAADRADAKVDDAINNGAELVRTEVKQDADRAVSARQAATQSESNAAASENAAASSASNAATSETNAKQSEDNAGDYAAVATTAATEAVDAMETVSDKADAHDVIAIRDRLSEIEPKSAGDVGDAAFAHVTEQGHRLPLGYTSDGRLDQLARRVWAEDVTGTYEVADSEYVHAVATGDMHLLLGVKADGTIEIPGLKQSVNEPASKWIHPDGGYYPTSVDTSTVVSWGSSSVAAMAGDFANSFSRRGITHVGRARGGEKIEHIAARMGAVKSLVYPVTIPATGGVNIVSRNVVAQNLFLAHTGWLGGVHGTLSHASGHTRFTRTNAGEEVTLTSMTEFIPDEGLALRDKLVILSVGKNDMGERGAVERVLDYTDRMVKFLTPLTPCVIVMGHFMDQDTEIGGAECQQIMAVNSALAARYGESYFDHAAALAGPEIWDRTGITPTSEDLAQQDNLRLPPSLAKDNQHQNDATNTAVAEMVAELADRLGWSHK